MKNAPWDHGLRVIADADGLAGHAGAVLTAALGSALARAGKFPLVERGVALVSMAVAIVLGAAGMSDQQTGRASPTRRRARARR